MEHPLSPDYFEDEIDLREIIKTLLRYKWLIIGITILAVVAGYGLTKLIFPKEYGASASVIITKPILTANLDSRIQTEPQTPDTKSLTELTVGDDLVEEVFHSPEVKAALSNGKDIFDRKKQLHPSLIGTSQLKLDVTAASPEQAALIANVWAKVVADHLNLLFGVGEDSLVQVQQQKATALENWNKAEADLAKALPQNRIDALRSSKDQISENYKDLLLRLQSLDNLLTTAKNFDSRLQDYSSSQALPLPDLISLASLQQQSIGGENQIQLQFNSSGTLDQQMTVGEARQNVQQLIAAMTSERQGIETSAQGLEDQLSQVAVDLETATFQLNQLTTKRDLAQNSYQALSSLEEETQISLSQNDRTVKVASKAIPNEKAVGPQSARNGLIAGAMMFILAVFFVLIWNWWAAPEEEPVKATESRPAETLRGAHG